MTTAIAINGVSMEYVTPKGTTHVLDNVSYEVTDGHFVAIVGPSGVGKTTLLRLLTGLQQPTGGEIVVRGKKITGPPQGLAVVLQDYTRSLMPWLTVEKNIALPLRNQKLSKAEMKERIESLLDIVVRTSSLVGGQSIARMAEQFHAELSERASPPVSPTAPTDLAPVAPEPASELSREEIERLLAELDTDDEAH